MYNTIYIARVQVENAYMLHTYIKVHVHTCTRRNLHAYMHQMCTSTVHAYMYNTYTCTLYCMHVPYMYMYTIIRVITSLKLSF